MRLSLLVILLIAISYPSDAKAYGGGGGFPPGYFDNHNHYNFHCDWKVVRNSRYVKVPKCYIFHENTHDERNDDNDHYGYRQRLTDFGKRFRNGHR